MPGAAGCGRDMPGAAASPAGTRRRAHGALLIAVARAGARLGCAPAEHIAQRVAADRRQHPEQDRGRDRNPVGERLVGTNHPVDREHRGIDDHDQRADPDQRPREEEADHSASRGCLLAPPPSQCGTIM
jgi:hypothetical protein